MARFAARAVAPRRTALAFILAGQDPSNSDSEIGSSGESWHRPRRSASSRCENSPRPEQPTLVSTSYTTCWDYCPVGLEALRTSPTQRIPDTNHNSRASADQVHVQSTSGLLT